MPCECCSNASKTQVLNWGMRQLKIPLNYCPVCGRKFHDIKSFIDDLHKAIQHEIDKLVIDENGNMLEQIGSVTNEEVGCRYEAPSLAVDLDKIDISREMKILGIQEEAE